jgi:hypothetical protein
VGVESWTFNALHVRGLYFLAEVGVFVAKAGVSMAKAGVFPWPRQVFALPNPFFILKYIILFLTVPTFSRCMWNSLHLELDFIKTWRINIDAYSKFKIKLNSLSEELVLSLDVLSRL